MINEIELNARETCRTALGMPTETKEQIDALWSFVESRENAACRTDADHAIWKTAFVFYKEANEGFE